MYAADHMRPSIPDYEVIKIIGRGSYGEVWLARSLTGTFVAIKVVHRHKFTDTSQFRREFDGVRRYEPLSRSHEGLVDVLHVGRLGDDEAFYYVMELADDASGTDPFREDQYEPDTPEVRFIRHGPSAIDETIRVAAAITSALVRIHEQGLIHRDIKLSNIVFCGGQPKLSDPGLVAMSGDAHSYVGTTGYVPPDGPGTERADLFAVGMVMYQMLTGNRVGEFPVIPVAVSDSGNYESFSCLNRVILKACAADASSTYRSAAELADDLEAIRAGQPLRHIRTSRRGRALAVSVVSILVIALMSWAKLRNPSSGLRLDDLPNLSEGGEQHIQSAFEYDFYIRTTNGANIWVSREAAAFWEF